jgi:hypothetical protein
MSASDITNTVFIENSARLPQGFRFAFEHCHGWKKLVDANVYAVELVALCVGWHFVCIAQTIKENDFGYGLESAINGAIKKVMKAVSKSGFNSFEVTRIMGHRMLNMHYVTVFAQPRQLRPEPFIRNHYPHNKFGFPDFHAIFWRAGEINPESKGL